MQRFNAPMPYLLTKHDRCTPVYCYDSIIAGSSYSTNEWYCPPHTFRAQKQGVNVKDVPAARFVAAFAAHLKKSGKIELPKWVDTVKTGTHKELSPYNPDWYYVRAASIARKLYLRGGIGIGTFKKIYGGPKAIGCRRQHFTEASGSIIRSILANLEKMGLVEKDKKGYAQNWIIYVQSNFSLMLMLITVAANSLLKGNANWIRSPEMLLWPLASLNVLNTMLNFYHKICVYGVRGCRRFF